jgi:hypothetical protein
MATDPDYRQAGARGHDLLIEANKLYFLIKQSSPTDSQQFDAAIQQIDKIQKHLNNLRTPIQHLSQQTNISWVTDNVTRPSITSGGYGWGAFILGLSIGIVIGTILH